MIKETEIEAIKQAIKDISIILRRVAKRENAANSRLKAEQNGNKLGRKKKRNDKNIRALRSYGLSMRAIAKIENISTNAVQRSLKCED